MKILKIVDRKQYFGPDSPDRYLVRFEGENPHAAVGSGLTQAEALGDMLLHFPEDFGVKIKEA